MNIDSIKDTKILEVLILDIPSIRVDKDSSVFRVWKPRAIHGGFVVVDVVHDGVVLDGLLESSLRSGLVGREDQRHIEVVVVVVIGGRGD